MDTTSHTAKIGAGLVMWLTMARGDTGVARVSPDHQRQWGRHELGGIPVSVFWRGRGLLLGAPLQTRRAAGITRLWQVTTRGAFNLDAWATLDRYSVNDRSLWPELIILLGTVVALC